MAIHNEIAGFRMFQRQTGICGEEIFAKGDSVLWQCNLLKDRCSLVVFTLIQRALCYNYIGFVKLAHFFQVGNKNKFIMSNLDLYLLFEISGFAIFIAILGREIYLRNRHRVFEILSCIIFGLILEIGNTYLAHTYSYSPNFFVKLFNVPLVIGVGWTVIIYSSMLLSDQYNIPWKLRPFMDALTALALDLSLDAVAIRLGFWHWAIPLDQEWYGVPFENLVGWILVVFSFSFLARFIRTLNYKRVMTKILMLATPILAYVMLSVGLLLFGLIAVLPYQINNWTNWLSFNYSPNFQIFYSPQVQLWKLIVLVVLIVQMVNVVVGAMIKYRRKYLRHFDLLSFIALSGMHLFFLFAIFIADLQRQMPILVFLSLLFFLIHLVVHLLPYLMRPSVVYVFEKVGHTIQKEERQIEKIIRRSLK